MTQYMDEVPDWESIKDPSLAYKQSSDDLFVANVGSSEHYLLSRGIIPITHSHFGDIPYPHSDASCYCEFMIQSAEIIARNKLGAAIDDVFVLRDIKVNVASSMSQIKQIRAEHTASMYINKHQIRTDISGRVYAIDGPAHCYIDGVHAADLDGTVAVFNPETYAIARGTPRASYPHRRKLLRRPAPTDVGRTQPENILIEGISVTSEAATAWVLSTRHPSYFDRPLDHYPGMMMAEAARQLSVILAHQYCQVPARELYSPEWELHFRRFAELDTPPRLSAVITNTTGNKINISVTVDQDKHVIMHSYFAFAL